ILCVVLETDASHSHNHTRFGSAKVSTPTHPNERLITDVTYESSIASVEPTFPENLFVNYMARIHRDEDFAFILSGVTRLLNNPLIQTYLPGSTKRVQLHQELLILFWRMCDINKKFMYYVLKSSQVLDILVPVLYHLNDARQDQNQFQWVGLVCTSTSFGEGTSTAFCEWMAHGMCYVIEQNRL
ncbi:unnamed protein product, partial [Protopolystoma xenopodis]